MAGSKLMQGTKVLTLATLISKMIGFLYIIPFAPLVGEQGLGLYTLGYQPYSIMIAVATMGVPVALSIYVSKYHALGDYDTAHRLFKSGIPLMLGTGLVAFLILFLSAPLLANIGYTPSENDQYHFDDVVFVIRLVSFALLIIPVMSLMRGYMQGFQQMVPTSVSQVLEQIVRIAFILIAAFLIMNFGSGNMPLAVGFATFAAFLGALGGLAVLIYYYRSQRTYILKKVEETKQSVEGRQRLPKMYKELISYALPLSFVGLSIPLFQMIDAYTIERAMNAAGLSQGKEFIGVLTNMAHKIVLIPMALATALSITLVPTITRAYVSGDQTVLQTYITQTYQVILFITIPASFGMFVLAEPIYYFLFGANESFVLGVETLRYYAPVTILFAVYAVTGSILQGMNRQKNAVLSLIIGLVLKLSLTYLFIVWFGPYGAIWTTYIGFGVALALNIYAIGRHAGFDYTIIFRRTILIAVFTTAMMIAVGLIWGGMRVWLGDDVSRIGVAVPLFISVGAGVIVYFYLGVRSHLAGKVLGDKFKLR